MKTKSIASIAPLWSSKSGREESYRSFRYHMKSPIPVFTLTMLLPITGCVVGVHKIDFNDNTPPTATIKVQMSDGQYAVVAGASINAGSEDQLKIMCIADDPDGVQSVALDYGSLAKSCSIDGGIQTGSFPIIGLPSAQKQTLQGDPSGQVLTTLPLLATISAPLACKAPGFPVQQGFPLGTLTVQCTATNWSSLQQKKSAVQNLTVTLK